MKKLLLFVPMILFIIGCGSGNGEQASLMGLVSAYYSYVDTLVKEGYVQGYGFKSIPLVTINNDTLPVDVSFGNPPSFYYHGPITDLNLGSECNLKVDYDEGKSEATNTLPGNFSITSPDESFVLHKGNDLNIAWVSSSGADWYMSDVWVDYDYIDTAGNYKWFSFDLDTIVHGTSYTVSANRLFPADVDIIYYGYGSVDVEAVSGPKIEPGTEGNIEGDAVGFFWCTFKPEYVYFGVGELAAKPKEDHQSEIRKKHLETMRKFAEENQ